MSRVKEQRFQADAKEREKDLQNSECAWVCVSACSWGGGGGGGGSAE
jgi:hypothetical protein